MNQKIENHSPCFCPKCGRQDARFIRKGFSNGKQRYQCKSCLKKFTFDANHITSWSHQSTDKWIVAIEDTLTLKSIQSLSDAIGVCRNTAFAMRYKILHALEIAISKEKTLDDLIEADETYALESQKGIKVLDRKPRKHGSKANKRGLSSEQICICVAVDRSGATIAKSVNRAKPTGKNIFDAIGNRNQSGSVFLCDGADSYNLLISRKNCVKYELISHEAYDKVHHLNTVNHLHSCLEELFRKVRGVSTKYLNRYLALFTFNVIQNAASVSEIIDTFRASIKTKSTFMTIDNLRHSNILSI